jgi:hypothetical protein
LVDFVTARDSDVFEFLNEFGEKGVGNFRDDEAEEAALAGDEGAGLGVGEIVEFGNGFPDTGGEDGVYGRDMIDGARDGGDRNPGERRYAADINFGGRSCVRRLACSFQRVGDLGFSVISIRGKAVGRRVRKRD